VRFRPARQLQRFAGYVCALGTEQDARHASRDICDDCAVADFVIRPARPEDVHAMAQLMADVAEERDKIGTEPPVDVVERAATFATTIPETVVADAGGRIVGMVNVDVSRFGYGVLGMLVDAGWRGRGVGSALLQAAIDLSRELGVHKLCLDVWPANAAALGLYRKFGFVEEGRLVKQYRRTSGELWDALAMGLMLD
jgi:L-amino acid N-acyltransferase YncA